MPNIAAVFKQETMRLARREVRSELRGLRRASAKSRRDVAQLKRSVAELLSEISRLKRKAGKAVETQGRAEGTATVRFRADGVGSHRKRLGMSAAEYSKLLGVGTKTVYRWEQGTARPRKAQLAALASIRTLGKREARARLAQMQEKKSGKRRPKLQ